MQHLSKMDIKTMIGRALSILIVTGALAFGLVVIERFSRYPRTDDAEIFANFIGIAPQVEGPIVRLNVSDNQFVKQGDLLFEIDDRDVAVPGVLLDGGDELAGHLAEQFVAGDLLAAMLAEEPSELVGFLELGDVGVEEDAVDRLVHEGDALIE